MSCKKWFNLHSPALKEWGIAIGMTSVVLGALSIVALMHINALVKHYDSNGKRQYPESNIPPVPVQP